MSKQLMVGQEVTITSHASRHFLTLRYECEARVEAVGYDWIVVRDTDGKAHAATFESHNQMYGELGL